MDDLHYEFPADGEGLTVRPPTNNVLGKWSYVYRSPRPGGGAQWDYFEGDVSYEDGRDRLKVVIGQNLDALSDKQMSRARSATLKHIRSKVVPGAGGGPPVRAKPAA